MNNIEEANLSVIADIDNSNVNLLDVDKSSCFNEEESLCRNETFIIEGTTSNKPLILDEVLEIFNNDEINYSSKPNSTFCKNNNTILTTHTFIQHNKNKPDITFTEEDSKNKPDTTFTKQENNPDTTFILNKNDILVEIVASLVKSKRPKDAVQFWNCFLSSVPLEWSVRRQRYCTLSQWNNGQLCDHFEKRRIE